MSTEYIICTSVNGQAIEHAVFNNSSEANTYAQTFSKTQPGLTFRYENGIGNCGVLVYRQGRDIVSLLFSNKQWAMEFINTVIDLRV